MSPFLRHRCYSQTRHLVAYSTASDPSEKVRTSISPVTAAEIRAVHESGLDGRFEIGFAVLNCHADKPSKSHCSHIRKSRQFTTCSGFTSSGIHILCVVVVEACPNHMTVT